MRSSVVLMHPGTFPVRVRTIVLLAHLLRRGIHPLNLWITLWVRRLDRAAKRLNKRCGVVCLFFEQQFVQ